MGEQVVRDLAVVDRQEIALVELEQRIKDMLAAIACYQMLEVEEVRLRLVILMVSVRVAME
jgi:hypothetical protein